MSGKTSAGYSGSSVYSNGPGAILPQTVDLIKQVVDFNIAIDGGAKRFHGRADDSAPPHGVSGVEGRLEDTFLSVQMEVLNVSSRLRIEPDRFFRQLSGLGDRTKLVEPEIDDRGRTRLWVEVRLDPSPMSLSRSAVFLDELRKIDAIAAGLQESLPELIDESRLESLYSSLAEYLSPVAPMSDQLFSTDAEMAAWVKKTASFIEGTLPVAVEAQYEIQSEYALAGLANQMMKSGITLGLIKAPAVNSKLIIELADKAPGVVVVPVDRLKMGTNVYDTAGEVSSMLAILKSNGKSALFTGTDRQLHETFHGGQGGSSDPLYPVVRHVPESPRDQFLRFVIEDHARKHGGLATAAKNDLFGAIDPVLDGMSDTLAFRLMGPLVNRQVKLTDASDGAESREYALELSSVRETLGGLSISGGMERSKHVQSRFTEVLAAPDLMDRFGRELFAQDKALKQLTERLRTECLTRPPGQPIRYCAQGTPATGKSRSAAMLAEFLGVPFMNIDAASMSSFYTASAQLLGSGRGIVGSYKSGRLEEAARHHSGAVIEISDLDHALPEVRSSLADLFLQVLETGQAQSAAGAMFSCANIIFAFTINLPNGMDEEVHKTFGFGRPPESFEIRKRVVGEIKNMFSTAFLSRIGDPILFEPLDGEAVEMIIASAVRSAIVTALERLEIDAGEVVVGKRLGRMIADGLDSSKTAFGARLLIEHARSLVAGSVMEMKKFVEKNDSGNLIVNCDTNGDLVFTGKEERNAK